MRIHIESEPEEPRKKMRPPVDYTSRAVRIKLYSMFAMLGLVLLAMNEARKPERWEWMGFTKAPATNGQLNASPQSGATQLPAKDNTIEVNDLSASNPVPTLSEKFWQQTFFRLSTTEQRSLFRILRCARQQKVIAQDASDLLESLDSQREVYDQQILNQMEILPAEKKQEMQDRVAKATSFWQQSIQPALRETVSGQEITIGQLDAVRSLQRSLDVHALSLVEDQTTLNKVDEGNAWLRCWESVLSKTPANLVGESAESLGGPPPVMHIQLTAQPAHFRGRMVEIDGWIRSAQKVDVKQNELGLSHYYVLWIRPKETNVAPYCVYTADLPSGFPHVNNEYLSLNERVVVQGMFFKLRFFEAADETFRNCPLVLAKTFNWKPKTEATTKVESWSPPFWIIVTALISLPLFASALAWWAFRGTELYRFVPGEKTQAKIENALVELTNNPNVQTDLEKIQELESLAREID